MANEFKQLFSPENYNEIEVGDILLDGYLGCTWKAVEKTEDGIILKNISGGENGVSLEVSPKTCRMIFVLIS